MTPDDQDKRVDQQAFALRLTQLHADNPADALALRLLARAACFAPGEPFPREWLEQTAASQGDSQDPPRTRSDAMERLLALGMLEQVDTQTVRLHPLLAASAALGPPDDNARSAVEQVIAAAAQRAAVEQAIAAAAQRADASARLAQQVLPHLHHLLRQAAGQETMGTVLLLNELIRYRFIAGAYEEVQTLAQRALAICERLGQGDHPLMVRSLNSLAALYEVEERYTEAQALHERALGIRERVLGPDHPDTARSLDTLAAFYEVRGRYAEALPLYGRALTIREQALGPDHLDVVQSLNRLAYLHELRGDPAAAQPFVERALAVHERVEGPGHPNTANSLTSLASLHVAQHAYDHALSLYDRALAIYLRTLGPGDLETRNCRQGRQHCWASTLLGPLPPAGDAQRARVLVQARSAAEAALRDEGAGRRAVAAAIEARARWAERKGAPEDRALAAELRALIALLGAAPGDLDALG